MGIWHLIRCHSSTKWLARVHHVVVFKTIVLHFQIENTPMKDTNGKIKFKRMLRFLFCWQTRAFRYEIVFRVIQPCFLCGVSERLACLNQPRQRRFWRNLRYILYSMVKESTFSKGSFCTYKGFMDVFYILTSSWKKNLKMCIWSWFFAVCSADLTCMNGSRIQSGCLYFGESKNRFLA